MIEYGLDPQKIKLRIIAQGGNTTFVIKLVEVPYPRDVEFIEKLKADAKMGKAASIEQLKWLEKSHWEPSECGFVYERGKAYRGCITNIGVPFKFMPYLEAAKGDEFTQEELQQILALPLQEEYENSR